MKKLSLVQKELFFSFGIGLGNLCQIISNYYFPLFFAIIGGVFVIGGVLSFILKFENHDEMSLKHKGEAGYLSLTLTVVYVLLIAIFSFRVDFISTIPLKIILYSITAFSMICYGCIFLALEKIGLKKSEN
ncbi:MAG: hypothetical protein PUE30_02950 [Spirochaetia bacterium]|nr:hypothetical protein [Spirochaetia bacterium]